MCTKKKNLPILIHSHIWSLYISVMVYKSTGFTTQDYYKIFGLSTTKNCIWLIEICFFFSFFKSNLSYGSRQPNLFFAHFHFNSDVSSCELLHIQPAITTATIKIKIFYFVSNIVIRSKTTLTMTLINNSSILEILFKKKLPLFTHPQSSHSNHSETFGTFANCDQ